MTTYPILGSINLPVNETDILRLFIEFTEIAQATDLNKKNLVALYRKVIQTGLKYLNDNDDEATFREAAEESLHMRAHRRPSTLADLRSYINRFITVADWVDKDIRRVTRKECRALLEKEFNSSGHVFLKAKSVLHSIFSLAIKQGWCEKNPVSGIMGKRVKEERIEILKTQQIAALMKAMLSPDMQCMQAAVRLMLWCGVRPGEIQRLQWRDIDFREKEVYIESHASKTGGARAIPLRGGALRLKEFRQKDHELIAPNDWNRMWAKLRRRAGFDDWQKDVLRHTFASMHLKYFHNLFLLQEEMGHRDSSLLRTRYLNLRNLSRREAYIFFNWDKADFPEEEDTL